MLTSPGLFFFYRGQLVCIRCSFGRVVTNHDVENTRVILSRVLYGLPIYSDKWKNKSKIYAMKGLS